MFKAKPLSVSGLTKPVDYKSKSGYHIQGVGSFVGLGGVAINKWSVSVSCSCFVSKSLSGHDMTIGTSTYRQLPDDIDYHWGITT